MARDGCGRLWKAFRSRLNRPRIIEASTLHSPRGDVAYGAWGLRASSLDARPHRARPKLLWFPGFCDMEELLSKVALDESCGGNPGELDFCDMAARGVKELLVTNSLYDKVHVHPFA